MGRAQGSEQVAAPVLREYLPGVVTHQGGYGPGKPYPSGMDDTPQMYLEPGLDPEVVRIIEALAPAMRETLKDDHLNCYLVAGVWEQQLRVNGVEVERIGATFLTERGPWGHEYLLVGADERIFDPTAAQFAEVPEPSRYIIEPGDTDDEPGWSVADWRADSDGIHPFYS